MRAERGRNYSAQRIGRHSRDRALRGGTDARLPEELVVIAVALVMVYQMILDNAAYFVIVSRYTRTYVRSNLP